MTAAALPSAADLAADSLTKCNNGRCARLWGPAAPLRSLGRGPGLSGSEAWAVAPRVGGPCPQE